MPEMTFDVRWPDGSLQRCYSPSLVMHDYLRTGCKITVAEFVDRSGAALREAGERVRSKYGFACTAAAATTEAIVDMAGAFPPDAIIEILAMRPELSPP